MTELDVAVKRFRALIAETPDLWRSIDVRALAGSTDRGLFNLICTARLDYRPAGKLPTVRHLPASPPIACFQRRIPIGGLDQLFEQLRVGEIHLGSNAIAFVRNASATDHSVAPYDSAYARRASRQGVPAESSAFHIGHLFVARGNSSQGLFNGIDDGLDGLSNALQRLPHPWDGIDSIPRYVLHTNTRVDYHSTASFEMYAPLEARLDAAKCILQGGKVTCVVVARPAVVRYVRIGYFGVTEDGTVTHGRIRIARELWTQDNGLMSNRIEATVPQVRRLTIFVSIGDSNIDRMELPDSAATTANSRVIGYKLTDPRLDHLKAGLTPAPGSDSKLFERAITRLFSLGGYITDGYTFEGRLTNGPDALAFAPDNTSILVIECTTGPLSSQSGKMSQLVSRVERLRQRLGPAAPGTVLPVMVSSLPRHELSGSELGDAATDGVVVLTAEDVQQLLDLTLGRTNSADVLAFCLARIPERDATKTMGAGHLR